MADDACRIGRVDVETGIDAPSGRVWQALTEEIGDWWPDEFYAGGVSGERSFSIDAEPGGRMLESWDGGGGTLWGMVVCAEPGRTLQVLGNQFPNWGGPIEWYGTWTLSASDGMTKLAFQEVSVGNVAEPALDEKKEGWQYLCAALKAHVEGAPAPVWGE